MITAIDTNILLDVFGADPDHGVRSKESLRRCAKEGALVACDVVWAELAAFFQSQLEAQAAMERLGIGYSVLEMESALAAGFAWKEYRRRGGIRKRLVADFLIGSHALAQADRLLARDRGFYRAYFSKLVVLDPTEADLLS